MTKKGQLKLTTYLKKRFYQPGLTLVELLVVLGIIGALGGIVTIEGERARDTARDHAIITHLSEAPAEALSYRGERATFVDFCQSPAWRQIQGGIIGQDRTVANITCHGTETHFCAQVALHTGGFFCVDGAGHLLRVDTLTCQAGHVGCVEPVGDIAVIFAEPTVFYFEATVNRPLPASQTLSIWNAGPGVLNWEIRGTPVIPGWLRLSATSGTSAGPGEVNSVIVSIVDPLPLPAPDPHSAVIEIRDNRTGAVKSITIRLRVRVPPPSMERRPATISLSLVQGTTTTQVIEVKNSGGGILSWTKSDDVAWITGLPISGTSTSEWDTTTITISAVGKTIGIHHGIITFAATGVASQTTPVTLIVTAAPPSEPDPEPEPDPCEGVICGGGCNGCADAGGEGCCHGGGEVCVYGWITRVYECMNDWCIPWHANAGQCRQTGFTCYINTGRRC